MTFCGQCGTEIAEKDGFCTACGTKVARKRKKYFVAFSKHLIKAKIIDVEHVQSVNNWSDIYQSVEKFSKEKQEKKRLAKEEKEKQEKKIIAKEKRQEKKRLAKEEKEKQEEKRIPKKEKEEKLEKYVVSPVVPQQSTFSFSGNRLPTMIIAGFVLGFITFAIIGMASAPDPYGCTQCDPFLSGYDGPPPIEMDLWVPDDYYYDDSYYYDDYYDGGYYP